MLGQSGPKGMLVSGGHSDIRGVNRVGMARWGLVTFKVVSGGYMLGLEGHRGNWSRDASGVTHRQAWSVGATLAGMDRRYCPVGDTTGSQEQWGDPRADVVGGEHTRAASKSGGHCSRVANGVTLWHSQWIAGTWVVRGAHSDRQKGLQQAGVVSGLTLKSGQQGHGQADRHHTGTSTSQQHSQWSTGTGGLVETHSGRALTGATHGQRVRGVKLWQGGQ